MTDEQKALAYYHAAFLRKVPQFVPATVRLQRDVFGDFPFSGVGALAGDHECGCNKWGAVQVKDRAGEWLGLRPDEFAVLSWRENEEYSHES
jgi:hypothetical protein